MAPAVARAALESLLRTRKLDTTLTTALPPAGPDRADASVPLGHQGLDHALGGGIARGQISEITGLCTTGRTALVHTLIAGATVRGELVAYIDTLDRFDITSAVSSGVVLHRLLWVRGEDVAGMQPALDPSWEPARARQGERRRTPMAHAVSRALKAASLVLSAGGFGLVVLDLADVPRRMLGALPFTTWLRLQRQIAGSDTACIVMAELPLARSTGGTTVRLEPRQSARQRMTPDPPRFREQVLASRHPFVVTRSASSAPRSIWTGELPSVRRFRGLAVDAHVQSGLRTATCPIDLTATARIECSPASV